MGPPDETIEFMHQRGLDMLAWERYAFTLPPYDYYKKDATVLGMEVLNKILQDGWTPPPGLLPDLTQ